ncbi:MAG: RNA polymerase sigma factor [Candidatus Cloacimonetes bacterium]|nr:RNA polymerase sigma factor [Candidatus Cloacimonadota bacterium]
MKEKILEEMMKNEGKKVFNMILRMVRQRQEAEDLYQEVFTAFYHNLGKVQPVAYKSYLYRIAYNKTLNQIKSRQRDLKFMLKQFNQPGIEEDSDPEQRNIMIRESLALLKPEEALLIELQFYQGKSYQEISEITGYSESAVDSRLVRAKRKLRELLERRGINNLQEKQFAAVL